LALAIGHQFDVVDRLKQEPACQRYQGRHLIENAFCRIKDSRRVATRYDKLATNFLSGVALATALAFWL